MQYWQYYDEHFDWPNPRICPADPEQTLPALLNAGMPERDALRHINSGYVYCDTSKTIIDRYYGGAIMSRNPQCRWNPEELVERKWIPPNGVKVYDAKSWGEVNDLIAKYRSFIEPKRRMFLRGQTENYSLAREIPNPSYQVQNLGEISLIPSIWRKMLSAKPDSFHEFLHPENVYWRVLLDRFFDKDEIEKRRLTMIENGEWIYSFQDMEDCDDPILKEYGKLQLDLAYGAQINLAATMVTLLQHYGMLSPVLDLTTDLDVARFFATHRLKQDDEKWLYEFVGTNHENSVIYVLREDSREMITHQNSEAVIKRFGALRPLRQSCVISMSSSLALNLPAEFITAVIRLNFTDDNGPVLTTKHLFPGPDEDPFLNALQKIPIFAKHLIHFPD